MRSKAQLGTVIEPNIFERSKNRIQRNNPSFEQIDYSAKINLSNFHFNTDKDGVQVESLIPKWRHVNAYEGEHLEKGEEVCDGSPDMQDILRLKGIPELTRYIVNEVQDAVSYTHLRAHET